MIFATREKENGLWRGFFFEKAVFPFSRGKNHISQGVENRGSLIGVPLALGQKTKVAKKWLKSRFRANSRNRSKVGPKVGFPLYVYRKTYFRTYFWPILGMSPKPTFELLFGYFIFLGISGLEAHAACHKGILGAALGIQNSILGIRNSILGMASHDLSNTKTTIHGATPGAIPGIDGNPHETFSFAQAFSERFFKNWGGPRAPDVCVCVWNRYNVANWRSDREAVHFKNKHGSPRSWTES